MADLDAVNLGLDENEADIAEELQDFEDSFDTRSEASAESSSSSNDEKSSMSSVSTNSSASPKGRRHLKRERSVNGANKKKKGQVKPLKSVDKAKQSSKSRKKKDDASSSSSSSESDSDNEDAKKSKANGKKVKNGGSPKKVVKVKQEGKQSAKENASGGVKSYDYMTKLNYLFRDTRFFLIKSNNADNVELSKSKSVWSTLPQNEANLHQAFKESRNVLLIFSVNESGKFAGFARMASPPNRDIPQVNWVLPPSISAKALGGVIEIDWICCKELSFTCTAHLYNSWNDGKPVKIGRDGQEIDPKVGAELCRLFPEDDTVELTPILRKSKDTAKMMKEKGIRLTYKGPPRSLSVRGRGGSGPPIRGKMPYHAGHHTHRHKGSHPPGGFNRSASPYPRDRVPPWERYVSAAAAEAYVADYMRNMHGQLPPLPFVPPFPNMIPNPGLPPGAPPPNMYEQMPQPARYYDGPALPEYPSPPTVRPPLPGGFDKRTPYDRPAEDAHWKKMDRHALPLMPGQLPAAPPIIKPGGFPPGSNYRKRDFQGRPRQERGGRDYRGGGNHRSDNRSSFRDRNNHRNNYRDRR